MTMRTSIPKLLFSARCQIRPLLVGCVTCLALAACGGGAPDADTSAAVNRVKDGFDSQAAGVQAVSTQGAAAAAARDEAAKVLGVPAGQVSVDRVEPVQWKDAALGCPAPGAAAAAALTPGVRFVVSAGGRHLEVHADAAGRMVSCETPTQ
jgi:hypothetical protein